MIGALRRRHRFAALGLAILLPPAYLAALAARTSAPVAAESLATTLGEESVAIPADRVRLAAPADAELVLPLTLGRDADGARVVELDSRGLAAQPDALVYWTPAAPQAKTLPPEVFLLGALPDDGERAYRLPAAASERVGSLLVFSVAWQRVLLVQSLEPRATP
jgi:hypothetical protein